MIALPVDFVGKLSRFLADNYGPHFTTFANNTDKAIEALGATLPPNAVVVIPVDRTKRADDIHG